MNAALIFVTEIIDWPHLVGIGSVPRCGNDPPITVITRVAVSSIVLAVIQPLTSTLTDRARYPFGYIKGWFATNFVKDQVGH
jgi:hypothetical protein